jgi:hypothetical protein
MKMERPRTPCALKEQVVRPNLDYVHYDGDDDNYDMQIMPNRKIIVPCTVILLCTDIFFFQSLSICVVLSYKMNLMEAGWQDVYCCYFTQDRCQWQAVVNVL